MSEKIKSKRTMGSCEKTGWDNPTGGKYFITKVVHEYKSAFGKIEDGNMLLNDCGKIIEKEWQKIFEITNELYCDAFVIMPNHIHAILSINETPRLLSDNNKVVEQESNLSYSIKMHPQQNSQNLITSFISAFETASYLALEKAKNEGVFVFSSVEGMINNNEFWLPNNYNRVISNKESYQRIFEYIQSNIKNWDNDNMNTKYL